MKVAELKAELEKLGHLSKDMNDMKKEDLVELLEQAKMLNSATESKETSIASEMSEDAVLSEPVSAIPLPTDIEWTDYVLGLMADTELDNGNPKTDGLRRIAEKLFGPFSIRTNVIEAPNINNGYRASVVVSLEFMNSGLYYDGGADVYSGNTDKKFAVHAIATAETRAEGRALRRALKLTKVLAAEELQNADIDEPTGATETDAMPSTMLAGLEYVASELKVDLFKVTQKQGYAVLSTKELNKEQGLKIMKFLGDLRRKTIEITDDIKT